MRICYVGGGGRLGFPFAAWSAHKGHDVLVVDVNPVAVNTINKGQNPHPMEPMICEFPELLATQRVEDAIGAELIFVVVPTPSLPDGSFGVADVVKVCETIGAELADRPPEDDPIVVVVSTVNPGDCESAVRQTLRESARRDIRVAYNPSFVRQGSIMHDFANPDVVLIGADAPDVCKVGIFHQSILADGADPEFYTMNAVSAEIAKIGLNATVVTKTATANQLAWLCHLTPGADGARVLESIGADSRVGHKYFGAGPPVGGPCFPRDNRALLRACQKRNIPAFVAEASNKHRDWELSAIGWQLGSLSELYDARSILFLGLTYKPGVNITEEAAGMQMWKAYQNEQVHQGRAVFSYDPGLDQDDLEDVFERGSYDLIAIFTDWPEFGRLIDIDLSESVVFDMWRLFKEGDLNCKRYIPFGRGEWE